MSALDFLCLHATHAIRQNVEEICKTFFHFSHFQRCRRRLKTRMASLNNQFVAFSNVVVTEYWIWIVGLSSLCFHRCKRAWFFLVKMKKDRLHRKYICERSCEKTRLRRSGRSYNDEIYQKFILRNVVDGKKSANKTSNTLI